MPVKIGDTNYTTYEDIWKDSILTPEEKASIQLKIKRVGKLIELIEKLQTDSLL